MKIGLREKIALLLLQILLPFVLYLAVKMANQSLEIAVAIMFGLSMLTLVVFG